MNYETLKAAVANVIKTNGNEEITGQLLQDVLMAIINALGSGYQFMGIATAETTPGTPDQRVFYLAGSAGSTVLPGFGITVDHEICVLMYSDEWEKQTLLQFDSVLTSGSQNLVTSGMVYNAVTNLSQAINGLAEIVGGHTTAIESLQETVGGHTTAINNLQYAVVAIQAAIESLQTDVAQKINKSDADSLVVGSAQGVLATSAVEAFFLFQQSGTTGDGAALIPIIKGKTIAWNQLFSPLAVSVDNEYIRVVKNEGTFVVTVKQQVASWTILAISTTINLIAGHKYVLTGCPAGGADSKYMLCNNYFDLKDYGEGGIFTSGVSTMLIQLRINTGCPVGTYYFTPQVVDLTLLGLGDLTASQFKTLYNKLNYSPVSGVLKSNDAVAMITNGRNQWDGTFSETNKGLDAQGNVSATDIADITSYIPIIGGQTYCISRRVGSGAGICFYDAQKNFIWGTNYTDATSGDVAIVTAPAGAAYMRATIFKIWDSVCINLSDPSFNGTYEPYWTRKVNLGLDAIKVKSPNIWNEQWENGFYNSTTGAKEEQSYAANHLRSKTPIPCQANKQYYIKVPSGLSSWVGCYDAGGSYLGSATITSGLFTTIAGTAFVNFYVANYGTSYNNDICINISAPGINGKYFPYGEDGILTYNGLDGVGTAFDFIFKDANGIQKLQKTMLTEVDLGMLDWTIPSGTESYFTSSDIAGIKRIGAQGAAFNIMSSKYPSVGVGTFYSDFPDKMIGVTANNTPTVVVKDSAYTDAATFKAAMAGVKLIAEAAEPAILELAEPIPDMFLTAQGGTMLIVSPEGATAPSAPFSADIIYPVDPIASSGASLKNLLEALKTATVITSYTMTFNSTTQQYEFTITK